MFTGKLTSSPFPPEQITKGKAFLEAWCKSWGFPGTKQPGDVDQEINIRLLQSFLSIAEDPDAPALDCYAEGVFLGHNRRMPRTPAVFEEKNKWRLGYVPPGGPFGGMGEELQHSRGEFVGGEDEDQTSWRSGWS